MQLMRRTLISCSAPNLQEEFSSCSFYPITKVFTDVPSIKPDHATWNVTWSVLIQIPVTVYFLQAVLQFCFITCIQIKSCTKHFIFRHLSALPRLDFPVSHGAKKHYWLVWAHAVQSFLFFNVFFRGVCKPCNKPKTFGDWTHKYHKMALSFISWFLYWIFLYLLSIIINFPCSYWNFFHYLLVLTYFDSSRRHMHTTTQATAMQTVHTKMTSLDVIFCMGNKSS